MGLSLRELMAATIDAALRGPGATSPELRREIASGQPPAELVAFVAKIRSHPYRITDEEFDALRARYDEDQLYEIIIAAAIGAADERLRAGMKALDAAQNNG